MSQANSLLTDERFADIISSSEEISKRFAALHKQASEQESAIAKLAPEVADELIKFACIPPDQKDAALLTLADPVKTLQLVKKLASFHLLRGEGLGQPADINQPAPQFNQQGIRKSASLIEAEGKLYQQSKDWVTQRPVK